MLRPLIILLVGAAMVLSGMGCAAAAGVTMPAPAMFFIAAALTAGFLAWLLTLLPPAAPQPPAAP